MSTCFLLPIYQFTNLLLYHIIYGVAVTVGVRAGDPAGLGVRDGVRADVGVRVGVAVTFEVEVAGPAVGLFVGGVSTFRRATASSRISGVMASSSKASRSFQASIASPTSSRFS